MLLLNQPPLGTQRTMPLSFNLKDEKFTTWALFGLTLLFGIVYWHLYSESVPALHIFGKYMGFGHINYFSEEYFDFLADKPNGYPAFLFLVKLFSPNKVIFVNVVILFQLSAFLLSVWYLSVRFYYFSNSRLLSLLLLLLILGNPEIIKFCFLVMTESFMMTLLVLILALSCQWTIRTKIATQHRPLTLISLCLGASILLRPICYAWIIAAILVLAVFYGRSQFTWPDRLKIIKVFAIPMLLCWMLGASFHYAKFGSFKKTELLDALLLTKVALSLEQQDVQSPSPFIKNLLDLHKPVHELMRHAQTTQMKYWIALSYQDGTRLSLPLFNKLYMDVDKQSKQAFIDMCIHHPVKYLKNIAMHYLALWQFWELMTPEDVHVFTQFSATYGLPFIGPIEDLTPIYTSRLNLNSYTTSPSFLLFIRTMMGIIWMVTLYFFVYSIQCLLNRKPITAPVWTGLIAATMIQVTYLITASVNVGAFRYAIVMWPAIIFVGVTFLLLFRKLFDHPRNLSLS